MANTAQAKKRARQAENHRQHNASMRSMLRTYIKRVIKAIQTGDKTKAESEYQTAVPVIDRMAKTGNPDAIEFPSPLLHSGDANFSFSGLKTAVTRYVNDERAAGREINYPDVVASFQKAAIRVLIKKVLDVAQKEHISTLTLSGGVAANSALRETLIHEAQQRGLAVFYPPLIMCTDNGAMIAGAAYHLYQQGARSDWHLGAYASL